MDRSALAPRVRAPFGPTLPEILGAARWRVARIVLGVAAVAGLVLVLTRSGDEHVVVVRKPVAFNFAYSAPLVRVGAAAVEQRSGRTFVQSMTARPLRLAPYRGDVGATLPVVADRLAARLARRWPGFAAVDEGRARVNDSPGYALAWEARLGARRLFGREYLLLPDEPGVRDGVRLELLATYAAGVGRADDVGRAGPIKRSLRSFRFGTDRP